MAWTVFKMIQHTTVFYTCIQLYFSQARTVMAALWLAPLIFYHSTMLAALRLGFTEEEIRRCKSTPPPNNHLVDPIEGPVSAEICVLHKDKLRAILSYFPHVPNKRMIRSGVKELDTRHLFELSQRRTPAERKAFYKKETAPLWEMIQHIKFRKRRSPDTSKLPEFQSLKDLVQKPSPKSKNNGEVDDGDTVP